MTDLTLVGRISGPGPRDSPATGPGAILRAQHLGAQHSAMRTLRRIPKKTVDERWDALCLFPSDINTPQPNFAGATLFGGGRSQIEGAEVLNV
jgi:hypothetical protein